MARKTPAQVLTWLRRVCLALPESAETLTWGHPVFRAGKKIFAGFGEHQGRPTLGFKTEEADREMLLGNDGYFPSPYAACFGWVSAWLDREVDWPFLEELLVKSYRLVAMKRMVRQLDEADRS